MAYDPIFQGMREIEIRRDTENGAAKFAAVFGLSTKTPRGGAFGPPIGSQVNVFFNSKFISTHP